MTETKPPEMSGQDALLDIIDKLVRMEVDLRRRQENLVRAQRMARIGSVEVDLTTMDATWSDELFRIYGRDPALGSADLNGFLALIHPDDRDLIKQIRAEHERGIVIGPNEFRVIRNDGEVRWIHREVEIVRDREGKPVTLFTTEQDVTDRRRMEELLRTSEERHRLLIGSVAEYAIFELTPEGLVANWNSGAQRIKGYAAEEIVGRHFSIFYTEDDRAANLPDQALRTAIVQGKFEGEGRRVRKDGSTFWANVVLTPMYDEAKTLKGFAKVTRDITERLKLEAELRSEHFRLLFAQRMARMGSAEIDLRTGVIVRSDEMYRVMGQESPSPLVGTEAIVSSYHPDDHEKVRDAVTRMMAGQAVPSMELRIIGSDGELRWLRRDQEFIAGADGTPERAIVTLLDVTEIRRIEERVMHRAYHDTLTDLPNRSLLIDRLDHAIAIAAREGRSLAVMFLDLDGFKAVNDNLGHEIGDELLKEIARRLQALVRRTDTVARLGGDEFVVLIDNPENDNHVAEIARRMVAAVNAPVVLHGEPVHVGVSIGVAVYPVHGGAAPELIKNADAAMYAVKKGGKNTHRFFDAAMPPATDERA
jgi:diguanylate cyclase (GGDEF)-like protein/PAS domain S-box-containing protein